MKIAFKSTDHNVLHHWDLWRAVTETKQEARKEFAERFGRTNLMVARTGFGHGTRVSGLPAGEGDPPEGWRLNREGFLIPNLRRKAGKDIAAEMEKLTEHSIDLPGMPPFTIGGTDGLGLASHSPMLFLHEGAVYAGWGTESLATQYPLWQSIPLSEFYAAKEAYDQVKIGSRALDTASKAD